MQLDIQSQELIRSETRWYDATNFPHGFSRCGHFTIAQSEFLEWYGRNLSHLSSGLIQPLTAAQHDMLKVIRNEKMPETFAELVWKRYLDQVNPDTAPFASSFTSLYAS